MGFNLKRSWDRVRDTFGAGSPWNDYREVSSPNPYDIGWNNQTLTPDGLRGPPTPDQAPAYQFLAEQKARELQSRLFGDARGQIDTAMGIFSRYRLGGRNAGAMLSLFQNQAQILGHQAGMVQAPDFMYRVREDAAIKAARAQERASRMQLAGGIIQAAATVAGGFAGGGLGAAAINAGGNVASSMLTADAIRDAGQGTMEGTRTAAGMSQDGFFGGDQPMLQWSPQQIQHYQQGMRHAMGGSPGWTPGGSQPAGGGAFPSGGGGGGAYQSQLPGQAGGGGGGVSGGPAGQNRGAGPAAGPGAPGGGGQGGAMGMQGPPNGGYGQDGDFTPKALASASVRTDPDVEEIVTIAYANFLQEDRSTDYWEHVVSGRLLRWAGAA